MIYTLTLSPSIDYYLDVPSFKMGEINRATDVRYKIGGKGINASRVLTALGTPNIAIFVYGGDNGEKIVKSLKEEGLETIALKTEGESRINVKINSTTETAINAPSPKINKLLEMEIADELSKLDQNDTLIISGKLGGIVGYVDFYDILTRVASTGVRLIFDISDVEFSGLFNLKPWLIKPNVEELEALTMNMKDSFNSLHEMGVANILLSKGRDGTVLKMKDRDPISISVNRVINPSSTVGAGDALLAATVHYYQESPNLEIAVRKAMDYVSLYLE